MTRGGRRTAAVVGVTALALLVYEGYTLANGEAGEEAGDTISETVWRGLALHPIVPFAFGFLAGHLVWQQRRVYQELSR